MNERQLRFTLSNTTLGDLVINDPIGWDTVPISLERHKDWFGVLETYLETLTGFQIAIPYLDAAKAIGIDVQVDILVELSEDFGTTWETFYQGLVDMESLTTISWPSEYKTQFMCKKNDVWTTFLKGKDTPVNVISTVDSKGNPVTPADIQVIELTPQPIQRVLRTQMYTAADDQFVDQIFPFAVHPVTYGFTIDLPKSIYNEITKKNNYPNGESEETPPLPIIETDEPATEYIITAALSLSNGGAYFNKLPSGAGGVVVKLRHLSGGVVTNYPFTRSDFGTNGINGHTGYSLVQTINNIKKGDQFTISIQNFTATTTYNAYIIPDDFYVGFQSYLNIVANTLPIPPLEFSKASAIKLFDVPDAIIKRLTCGDNFDSDFFSTGCGATFVNLKGRHIRGASFTDAPFSPTIAKWFNDADAIFNLGIGYEGGKIIIEPKEFFLDNSSNSVNLDFVNNVSTGSQKGVVINGAEIGYSKSAIGSGGALLNDPQGSHKYVSPARLVGRILNIMSNWIAASSLFELTRRAQVKPGEKFDTDEDIFVLKVEEGDVHGELKPDLNYTASANLTNPDTLYNKTITPGRNILRWLSVLNIGLTQYIGGALKFASGVGNILCSITVDTDACDTVGTVIENADIVITSTILQNLDRIEFAYPLTWEQYKLIRDNKTKSIGISVTDADHVPYFIEKIMFYISGKQDAQFSLVKAI